eukprot:3662325-Pyramimonas_sp.AAC.1
MRGLLTRKRRHVAQGSLPLPTIAPCSPERGRLEPSLPPANTSSATRTACARRTGRTWAASDGGLGARLPRAGPQRPKRREEPQARPGRACPRQL